MSEKITEKELLKKIEELENQNKELTEKLETPKVEEESKPNQDEVTKHLNEKVPFFAIKDNDKYKDDIVVAINGYTYVIQRGKHVEIPRYVYQAIEGAERQRTAAAEQSQGLVDLFASKSKSFGV